MTKEKLESYLQLKCKANSTYRIWQDLNQQKLSLSVTYDDMPRSSNKRTLADVVTESDARACEYYEIHLKALKQLSEIEQFISSIDVELHQNILRLRYIEGKKWWQVAKELGYSEFTERHFRRIVDRITEERGEEDAQTHRRA